MTQDMASARAASTVIVLREGTAPFEVLLVKRHDNIAFMGGAYVFPGGRVDEGDAAALSGVEGLGLGDRFPRFPDLDLAHEWAYRRAAVRELAEEANVRVLPADLEPLAHWVTPEVEIRRYDTRFFLARMPDGQEARHDDSETTALAWLTPEEAIARCVAREILLPPPTWTTLRQLERCASVDAVFAAARTRPIVCIQPGFIKTDTESMLTLPGDPLFPTIPGWDVPAETRFVLEEGNRWLPRKP